MINALKEKFTKYLFYCRHITQYVEMHSHDVYEQQKDRVHACSFFSLALDESTDIYDVQYHPAIREGNVPSQPANHENPRIIAAV